MEVAYRILSAGSWYPWFMPFVAHLHFGMISVRTDVDIRKVVLFGVVLNVCVAHTFEERVGFFCRGFYIEESLLVCYFLKMPASVHPVVVDHNKEVDPA